MKTAAELHYLQHPVGSQLLPYFSQCPHARRHIPLINLPRLADWLGSRQGRAKQYSQKHAPSQT